MDVQSAFNAGVQGFQKATETANQAATEIAEATAYSSENLSIDQNGNDVTIAENRSPGDLADLNQSIVDLKVSEYQAKASASVIKTADENLGTLIDVSV